VKISFRLCDSITIIEKEIKGGKMIVLNKKLCKALTIIAFLLPWIIGFFVLFVYAIGQSFMYSFTNYNLMNKPVWIGFTNYTGLLKDKVFWEVLKNTFLLIIILVPGTLILSFFFAIIANTKARFSKFAGLAYFLPYVLPLAATGLVWRWMFNAKYGVVNYVLNLFGIEGISWLASSLWVKPAIIIVQLTLIGQCMIIFIAALQSIPSSLYEAASIDGAGPIIKTLKITVPMVSPAILFNLVTLFIVVFQLFDIPYIMTFAGSNMQAKAAGGPGWSSTTYAMYMYHKMFLEYDAGTACAMAIIGFIIILGITIFMMRYSDKFVHYGS